MCMIAAAGQDLPASMPVKARTLENIYYPPLGFTNGRYFPSLKSMIKKTKSNTTIDDEIKAAEQEPPTTAYLDTKLSNRVSCTKSTSIEYLKIYTQMFSEPC
jgi:hypothetical protein